MKHKPLRPEWEQFVNEYLVDLNATRAAHRCGFGDTRKSSATLGNRLLRKVEIRRTIRKRFKDRMKRLELKQDDVVRQLTLIAFSDIVEYQVNEQTGRLVTLGHRQSSQAVQSVKCRKTRAADGSIAEVITEVRLWDKLKALELLMKHLGLFNDEVSKPAPLSQDELHRRLSAILEKRKAALN